MSEQQGWRKVSEWGQPTADACPWGVRWKAHEHGPEDISRVAYYLPDPSWWQPLPPPVDEVLPPPEPEWSADELIAHVNSLPADERKDLLRELRERAQNATAEHPFEVVDDAEIAEMDAHVASQEIAPPPEPEQKWVPWRGSGDGYLIDTTAAHAHNHGPLTQEQAQAAATVLNAVDAGETVGRVRPWQEAPNDDTWVLGWCDGTWLPLTQRYVRKHELSWMAQPAPPEEVEG